MKRSLRLGAGWSLKLGSWPRLVAGAGTSDNQKAREEAGQAGAAEGLAHPHAPGELTHR